ncbi:RHS repeat domain-containing protein [Actinomadura gamaensis]|uniref:RHS repeat domain-containing protein n=1 Tax=Actinomadura gamaensis TaxID=1763541 RepID=A0ABV9TTJ5_9ACTN
MKAKPFTRSPIIAAAEKPLPEGRWPDAGTATVDLKASGAATGDSNKTGLRAADAGAPVKAGGLPIWVGRGPTAAPKRGLAVPPATAERVQVDLLDHKAAQHLGVGGIVVKVTPQASPASPPAGTDAPADKGTTAKAAPPATPPAQAPTAVSGPVEVTVDYAGFANVYGGDFGSRLTLVALPDCSLNTPQLKQCRTRIPIKGAHNNVRDQKLVARVNAPATGMVLAATAGPSGQAGDYSATSLSPSATWQVAAQSGSFSWKYPFRVAPGLGGPTPELSLQYNSGGIDGRVASVNNQPSWVGDGFEMAPGFIERKYRSCTDDGHDDDDGDGKGAKHDLCWGTDNATMSFGGRAGELVKKSANEWRLKSDDGTRIERKFDGFNDDKDHEYWLVTTPDGTRYYFGRGRRSAQDGQLLNSAWTAPVFGDDDNEPCHADTFASSFCNQGWRWNLDYVVDAHGNSMTYFYKTESNKYGRNEADTVDSYIRGGYLDHVEYGQREGSETTTPAPARVSFGVEERCMKTGSVTCTYAELKKETKNNWPDVPFDQICTGEKDPDDKDKKPCEDQPGPSFFTTKMLSSLTTQVYDPASKTYKPVDQWTFDHKFLDVGEGLSRQLWLDRIHHKGMATGAGIEGGDLTLPDVVFDPVQRANRVDSGSDNRLPLIKNRVRAIVSESGGTISVNYSEPKCTPADVKDADPATNDRYCYPAFWTPINQSTPVKDWFQKYVVESVVEDNRTGGGVPVETYYKYLDKPAWHWDNSELVKHKERTWSQYRGFSKVQIAKGRPGPGQQVTEFTYLRGMDNDRLNADGTKRRDINVSLGADSVVEPRWTGDPVGRVASVADKDRWQGYQLEQVTYNNGKVVSGSVTVPWISEPTATDTDDKAYLVGTALTENRTALAAGGWRRTRVDNTYDDYGMLLTSTDMGDLSKPNDEGCTLNTYARNSDKWLLTLVGRVETLNAKCGDPAIERPKNVISDVKTTYNGAGDAVKTEKMTGYTDGKPNYLATARVTFDPNGRVLTSTDAKDNTTKTNYIPASGGPVTGMSVTNPLGHTVTSTVQPAWGLVTGTTDANKRVTTMVYDSLGHRRKVWLPGRATSTSPNLEYEYLIRQNDPTVISTKKLMPNGNISTSYDLFDGMMRKRQSQVPGSALDGGRSMTETVYDSRGLAIEDNGPFWNKDAPTTSLLNVTAGDLPTQTVTEYDGAGRKIKQTARSRNEELWSTTTTYGGDRVSATPPRGTTPTTTLVDAQGRTTELWQYKGTTPEGEHDTTRYTYNKGNQLASVTDPAGNTWTNEYDTLGRLAKTTDPDKGDSETHYNDLDQVEWTSDAEGRKLYYAYDALGRKTSVRAGSATGTLLTSWSYDQTKLPDGTVAKGQPSSSTRYVGGETGAKYVTSVTGYDDGYRPKGSSLTVPSVPGEEKLANTYTATAAYRDDGTLDSTTQPAVGGLPQETIRTGYDLNGLPVFTKGQSTYVMEAKYSNFGEPYQYTLGLSSADKWVSLTYGYEDATRRLTEARVDREGTGGGNPDSHVFYNYDDTGNPLQIADKPEGKPATQHDVQCFQYDYLRRLTEAWAQGAGACAAKPAQDTVGGVAPYWESFSYDAVGNRTGQVSHKAAGDTSRTYFYPAPGSPQPHTLKGVTQTGPDGNKSETYTYDKTGNTKTRQLPGWNSTLDWDVEGHLAKNTDTGKGTTEFLYDAGGNRLLRREAGSATVYLGGTEIKLDKKTGQISGTRYYSHNGTTVAVRDNSGKVTFLAGDHHGTNDIAIDAKTMTVTQRRFLPFGNPRDGNYGSWPTDKGFVGGTVDSSTGLVHLGARQYDPNTGRFISLDPVVDTSDPQQMHGYSYSYNNPLAFTDPTGLWGWSDWGHLTLDVIGYVPVVGEVADVANGVWYAAEGNYVDAGLSFGSAIPLVGYGASAAKALKTADKAVEGVDTVKDIAKTADKAEDFVKTSDNLTPPNTNTFAKKAPENPAPAKPREQPAAKGKADDGGSPSGSKGDKGGGRGDGESGGRGSSGGQKKSDAELSADAKAIHKAHADGGSTPLRQKFRDQKTTVAVGELDGELVYTVNRNKTSPQMRDKADELGYRRVNGKRFTGPDQTDAEQVMLNAVDQGALPASGRVAPSRPACGRKRQDCAGRFENYPDIRLIDP